MGTPIVTRTQVLAYRQRATYLHRRLSRNHLVDVAYAGLQDSAPRSAILALHARLNGVLASDWEDPRLAQVWGPRGAIYEVPRKDVAVFTIGREPRDNSLRAVIESAARRVVTALANKKSGIDRIPSALSRGYLRDLRLASMTGRIQVRWDGSSISWQINDPPTTDPEIARLQLARRFLRSLGPSTPTGFAWWAGVPLQDAKETFGSLSEELLEVSHAKRPCWILKANATMLEESSPSHAVRLLPAGDPYLGAADRELLVTSPQLRAQLWPKSVWPGALFVRGQLAGTWRRQQGRVAIYPWTQISPDDKEVVAEEVDTMPLGSATRNIRWERPLVL